MELKTALRWACLLGMFLAGGLVQAQENADNRIRLLIYPVDTVDERMDKQTIKRNIPELKRPYTEGDLSKLSGKKLADAMATNAQAELEHNRIVNQVALQEYVEAVNKSDLIKNKKQNTTFGRVLGNVADWLGSSFNKYSDVISIISRTDMQEGESEQNITQGGGNLVLASGKFKLKPMVSDLKEFDEKVQLPGGIFDRKTVQTTLTVRVEQFDQAVGEGNSFSVPIKAVTAGGGAVARSGDDGSFDAAIKKGMDEAAQKVAEFFTTKLTVKVKGPKDNKDFDPAEVSLTLDGNSIQCDTPIRIIKGKYLPDGNHTLQAELDGFETVTIKEPFNMDTIKAIGMKPDNFELIVKVKGSAGNEGFDASKATITLDEGADGETTLTAGEATAVKKGKHTLKISMEGYVTKDEPFTHSAKATKTITLIKAQ